MYRAFRTNVQRSTSRMIDHNDKRVMMFEMDSHGLSFVLPAAGQR